MIGATALR